MAEDLAPRTSVAVAFSRGFGSVLDLAPASSCRRFLPREGQFRIALQHSTVGNNIDERYVGDDGYRPEPEQSEDDGTFEVEVASKRYKCQAAAQFVMAGGALTTLAGAVVASRPPDHRITGAWVNVPVHDQSGYIYNDTYWDPNQIARSEGSDPGIHDGFGTALVLGGAVVTALGSVANAGCFLIGD